LRYEASISFPDRSMARRFKIELRRGLSSALGVLDLLTQLKDLVAWIWLFSSAPAIANCCVRLENRSDRPIATKKGHPAVFCSAIAEI
jgi:hypothetical protein